MKWFRKKNTDKDQLAEMLKQANESIKISEEFTRIVEDPNSTPEQIEAATKTVRDWLENKKGAQPENNNQISK
jgi:hypothetical protein